MGRSNPNKYVPNPAKFTVQWSGKHGKFNVYDTANKEKVMLDLPFRFAWVETLASITGYNKKKKFFIRANEVKSTKEEAFSVYHYWDDEKVVDFEGMYDDIKEKVKSSSYGGKFTSVVYGVADGDNGPIKEGDIIRIEMAGSALSAWIEKKFREAEGGICVEETEFHDGDIKYHSPVFKQETVKAELEALAYKADDLVQAWIDQTPAEEPDVEDEEEEEVPF